MDTSRIMVVIGERQWTLRALHLACAVARSRGDQIVLLKMVPVRHLKLLGTDLGYMDLTLEEQSAVRGYAVLVALYGIQFTVCVFQYTTYLGALVDAADQLDAARVFAILSQSVTPFWHRLRIWWLKRALTHRHRSLYTLERPGDVAEWTPLVTFIPEFLPVPSDERKQQPVKTRSWRQGWIPHFK